MEPSVTEWQYPPKPIVALFLKMLHRLHLLRVTTNHEGQITESTNFTILNLWLVWFGPMREDRLAIELLVMQTLCGLFGLFVRHNFALWIFESDNWTVR
jgi:UDP-N-acetylglucosamine--dolichyl-phosphate N-acetylglucosaminephosphotransferase